MTHSDYGELMSLALDGRLSVQERASLQSHLATCAECRAQWAAFQQVNDILSGVAQAMPAPGFAVRFATRLACQPPLDRRQTQRTVLQLFKGISALAIGSATLALLTIVLLIAAWNGLDSVVSLVANAPELLGRLIGLGARWLVTLSALGEAGHSILSILGRSGGPIVMGYMLILILITAAWSWVMRSTAGRRNPPTLIFV